MFPTAVDQDPAWTRRARIYPFITLNVLKLGFRNGLDTGHLDWQDRFDLLHGTMCFKHSHTFFNQNECFLNMHVDNNVV